MDRPYVSPITGEISERQYYLTAHRHVVTVVTSNVTFLRGYWNCRAGNGIARVTKVRQIRIRKMGDRLVSTRKMHDRKNRTRK